MFAIRPQILDNRYLGPSWSVLNADLNYRSCYANWSYGSVSVRHRSVFIFFFISLCLQVKRSSGSGGTSSSKIIFLNFGALPFLSYVLIKSNFMGMCVNVCVLLQNYLGRQ